MAKRFAVGEEGWIEVSREVQSATYQMSGETGKGINECVAELLTGATDPLDYEELQESEDAADAEADEAEAAGD
jgi:hypothetical protein